MHYLIEYEIRMCFAEPVRDQHCELRLAPRDDGAQRLLALTIATEPAAEPASRLDCFGNLVHAFHVLAPHERLRISVTAEVECRAGGAAELKPLPVARERAWLDEVLRAQPRLLDYLLHRSAAVPDLDRIEAAAASPAPPVGEPAVESLQRALAWVGATLTYDQSAGTGSAALAEVWARRRGTSRDFAHLLIALLRSWRLPARYVTGYLHMPSAETGAEELSGLRAWVEVLIPNAGWRGVDPVWGVPVAESYVVVASGRDGDDVPAQRCSFKGAAPEPPLEGQVRVQRRQD